MSVQKIHQRLLASKPGDKLTFRIDGRNVELTNLGERECSACSNPFISTEKNRLLCLFCFYHEEIPVGQTCSSNEFAAQVREKYNDLGLRDETFGYEATNSGVAAFSDEDEAMKFLERE